MRIPTLLAAVALLSLGVPARAGTRAISEAKVGEPHLEVRLPTIERDRTVALSDFRGKKVLLIEFASW